MWRAGNCLYIYTHLCFFPPFFICDDQKEKTGKWVVERLQLTWRRRTGESNQKKKEEVEEEEEDCNGWFAMALFHRLTAAVLLGLVVIIGHLTTARAGIGEWYISSLLSFVAYNVSVHAKANNNNTTGLIDASETHRSRQRGFSFFTFFLLSYRSLTLYGP